MHAVSVYVNFSKHQHFNVFAECASHFLEFPLGECTIDTDIVPLVEYIEHFYKDQF